MQWCTVSSHSQRHTVSSSSIFCAWVALLCFSPFLPLPSEEEELENEGFCFVFFLLLVSISHRFLSLSISLSVCFSLSSSSYHFFLFSPGDFSLAFLVLRRAGLILHFRKWENTPGKNVSGNESLLFPEVWFVFFTGLLAAHKVPSSWWTGQQGVTFLPL